MAGARSTPLSSSFHSVEKPSWELSSTKMSTEKAPCTQAMGWAGRQHGVGLELWRRRVDGGWTAARGCGWNPSPASPRPALPPHHEAADILVLGVEEAVCSLADGGLQVGSLLLDLRVEGWHRLNHPAARLLAATATAVAAASGMHSASSRAAPHLRLSTLLLLQQILPAILGPHASVAADLDLHSRRHHGSSEQGVIALCGLPRAIKPTPSPGQPAATGRWQRGCR